MCPVKLDLLTKYLLNINLTGVTYKIIRMTKNKTIFCNGNFKLIFLKFLIVFLIFNIQNSVLWIILDIRN